MQYWGYIVAFVAGVVVSPMFILGMFHLVFKDPPLDYNRRQQPLD